jgi:hypothetical protein
MIRIARTLAVLGLVVGLLAGLALLVAGSASDGIAGGGAQAIIRIARTLAGLGLVVGLVAGRALLAAGSASDGIAGGGAQA